MKKLLYICALFVLQSQAQTHSFAAAEKSVSEPVKGSCTTYYLKSSGDLTQLSSWGNNPDGSGETPLDFQAKNTFKIANRTGNVSLTTDWAVKNVEISNNINLSLGDHTFTINGGSIKFSGNSRIKGSPNASIVVNSSEPVNLVFDNTIAGVSNSLKNLTLHLESVPEKPASLTLLSDLHIYRSIKLNSGDLVIVNNDVYLKSSAGNDAQFEAPGLSDNKANVYYNGTGRFIIEHLRSDGKKITSLIAHPFTEQAPNIDDAVKEGGLIFGSTGDAAADTSGSVDTEKELSKNQIKDDIELFLQNKFWDLYTRPRSLDNIFC